MFSKLTALVAEVVGLTPQQSRQEDFSTHWRDITNCISSADEGVSVKETEIPGHLEAMVELLCKEDTQKGTRDPGTMGPCLEFMLRHRILNTLYTPFKNNYPSGIRHEVLMFLIHTLGRMEQPLLPHVSVHQPVQKYIQLCGLNPKNRVALQEIQFLRTLCLKINSDPRLAEFLLAELPIKRSPLASPPTSPSSSSVHSTITNPLVTSSSFPSKGSTRTAYLVAEALQRLVNHNDNLVVMKAYECLLSCVSLQHEGVARVLASSQLPVLLASKLQYHYQLVPASCSHVSIIGCNTGWGVDYATRSTTADHSPSTYGLWHVEAYLSWLDYVEQAVVSAPAPLYQTICTAVQELLLEASLMPRIIKLTEEDILLSTSILSRSIQYVKDVSLLSEFVVCVLGRGGGGGGGGGGGASEGRGGGGSGGVENNERGPTVCELIAQRIDHPSDNVCQATLHLIDSLLQSPLAPVFLRELVLNGSSPILHSSPSSSSHNHKITSPHSTISTWSPHTPPPSVESLSSPVISTQPHLTSSPRPALVSTPCNDSGSGSGDLACQKEQLQNLVSSYLSLVPVDLLSAEIVTGDPGIEDYLIEAHKQVLKCRVLTQSWNDGGNNNGCGDGERGGGERGGGERGGEGEPGVPTTPKSLSQDESPLPPNRLERKSEGQVRGRGGGGGGRGEGPLVPALLSKLERLLDQSYEVNLLLTAVFSRLASFHHPIIDQLFSPQSSSSSSSSSHNSVFSILKKVSSELGVHADRSPGFQFNLREVRKRMVGRATSDLLSMPHNDLLEGAIVLEEFCKEISCVLFAKHSTALLALPSCDISSPTSSPSI